MAVLDTAQPLQVEGGEGKIHAMAARHARLAMKQALVQAKRHAVTGADPRPFVRRYPLATLGGAAAVGLATALVAVPSEKQRASRRLRAIERALRDEAAYEGRPTPSGESFTKKRLFRYVMRYAKPTLISFLTSALTGALSGGTTAAAVEDEGQPAPPVPPQPGPQPPPSAATAPPFDVT